MGGPGSLLAQALQDLKTMADPAIQIWVWVASFLGSLAQEGEPLDLEAALRGRGLGNSSAELSCFRFRW